MNGKVINYIFLALSLILLSACSNSSEKVNYKNENSNEVENEKFKLILESEKAVYKMGEPLEIKAKLIYQGEKNSIKISYGNSPIIFSTTNITNNYQYGASMFTPLTTINFKSTDSFIEPYIFSGGPYVPELGGEPYTEDEFNQMLSGNFPEGQYKITAITDFSIKNLNIDNMVKLQTSIIITIN